jgi:antitoxin component of MazEF toxin-antitoxin module
MSDMPLVSVVESEGVVVPVDVLEAIGLRVGDRVNVSLGHRELILRPAAATEGKRDIEEVSRDVFERRKDAYKRLA